MKKNNTLKKVARGIGFYTLSLMLLDRVLPKHDHMYDIGDYVVHINEHTMRGNNMIAETRTRFGNDVYVATGGLFELFPEDVRKCILAHEVGHLVLEGGMPEDMTTYALTRIVGLCPKAERVADSMSVALYGKKATLKMLCSLFAITLSPESLIRMANVLLSK